MRRSLFAAISMLLLAPLLPRHAQAQSPRLVPVQGTLRDAEGALFDGDLDVAFALYDVATSGTALYSENQTLSFQSGSFTAYVGAGTANGVDLALFRDHEDLFLGISVDGSDELAPRVRVGTAPYAGYAEFCGEASSVAGVSNPGGSGGDAPTGAVMFFDLDTCPEGWSPLDAARGRAIVATPEGGALRASVGTPLEDGEDRSHNHTVNPASTSSTAVAAHSHTVNPGSFNSSSAGGHSHGFSVPAHAHRWGGSGISADFRTWNGDGDTNVQAFVRTSGSSGTAVVPVPFDGWTERGVGGASSGTTDSVPNHSHAIDVPNTTSSSAGGHSHDVDLPATASSNATTANVMPYIQLLACRKN